MTYDFDEWHYEAPNTSVWDLLQIIEVKRPSYISALQLSHYSNKWLLIINIAKSFKSRHWNLEILEIRTLSTPFSPLNKISKDWMNSFKTFSSFSLLVLFQKKKKRCFHYIEYSVRLTILSTIDKTELDL